MTKPGSRLAQGNVLGKAILLVLLTAGLCLTLLALLDRTVAFDFGALLSNPWLAYTILLQLLALALFVCAWYVLLRGEVSSRFPPGEAAAHIGVTLLGKYLPGKVWGLLGRGYLLGRHGVGTGQAANLLLADQFLTFFTGLVIGCSALLAVYVPAAGLLMLILLVGSSPLLLYRYNYIMQSLLRQLSRLFKRFEQHLQHEKSTIGLQSLQLALLTYLVHWLLIGLVMALLFLPLLNDQPLLNSLLIVAAIPLAMLSGFIALWAPGGIGVREAVIIAVLVVNLDLELATSIAISYRLVCVVNDLLMGCFALAYFGRQLVDE